MKREKRGGFNFLGGLDQNKILFTLISTQPWLFFFLEPPRLCFSRSCKERKFMRQRLGRTLLCRRRDRCARDEKEGVFTME